jgi:two-component system LytT family sensor kinase
MQARRWNRWVGLVAACSAFAACNVFSWYPVALGRGPNFRHALIWELLRWNLWLPIAAALLNWEPSPPRRSPTAAALWCGATAAGFSIAHSALLLAVYFPLSPIGLLRMIHYRPQSLLPDLLTGCVVSGLILGLAHARAQEIRAARLQTELAQAHLEALKMQLHPHFLFNTLNTIASLDMEDQARRMLVRLSDFLRLTLESSGVQRVRLAREVEFLSRYLEIERARFGDKLTIEIEVDPDARDAMVPTLILQPIVENAVRHGVSAKAAPGKVGVYAERRNGSLLLSVRDTGPGLHGVLSEGRGLGITRSRLSRIYGPDARLSLENSVGGGLEAQVEIPFERDTCAS